MPLPVVIKRSGALWQRCRSCGELNALISTDAPDRSCAVSLCRKPLDPSAWTDLDEATRRTVGG